MRLNIYNEGKILAPLKCGTRFLDETFGEKNGDIGIFDLSKMLFLPKEMEVIILRPPYEHLISALHTEILGCQNNDSVIDKNSAIMDVIEAFTRKNHNLESATHWSGYMYKHLYWIWKRNKRIKVIELKDLSNYLVSIGVNIPEYDPGKYNFNHYGNWCTKEDIEIYVKYNFPTEWEDYMYQVKESDKYYNYLIGKIETPMI